MTLTRSEQESLLEAKNRNPHQLLGMHSLDGGAGLVVRAFLPNAAIVEVVPTKEQDKPQFKLERLDKNGLFEVVTKKAQRIYAYDLVVTDHQGNVQHPRVPYSFLPPLGKTDLIFSARAKSNAFTTSS